MFVIGTKSGPLAYMQSADCALGEQFTVVMTCEIDKALKFSSRFNAESALKFFNLMTKGGENLEVKQC